MFCLCVCQIVFCPIPFHADMLHHCELIQLTVENLFLRCVWTNLIFLPFQQLYSTTQQKSMIKWIIWGVLIRLYENRDQNSHQYVERSNGNKTCVVLISIYSPALSVHSGLSITAYGSWQCGVQQRIFHRILRVW